MVIPSGVLGERSPRGPCNARKATGGLEIPDRSRDVLLPGETRLYTEGPTIWTCQGLPLGGKMPMGHSPVERNRERELGLDRRETG